MISDERTIQNKKLCFIWLTCRLFWEVVAKPLILAKEIVEIIMEEEDEVCVKYDKKNKNFETVSENKDKDECFTLDIAILEHGM